MEQGVRSDRLGAVLCAVVALFFGFRSCWIANANGPLPAWLNKSIAERQASRSRDYIEEATYQGKRAFEFISGDRFDAGDEHVLFDDSGKELCKFGGFVGHVTSGSCDIEKIIYVRTIFPTKPSHTN
jgi:hypothetical protein